MVTLLHRAVQALDRLVPAAGAHVVCHSFPDVDDMVVALLGTLPPEVRVTILANDRAGARRRLRDLGLPAVTVRAKSSPRGLWAYVRASHTVSTHGLYGARSRGWGKVSSTPWHGELTKQVGRLIGQPPKYFDVAVVSSLQSKFLMAAEFGLPPANIHVVGTPRQSTLFAMPRAPGVERLKGDTPWVLFVPTYRRSSRSRLDVDNELSAETENSALVALAEAAEARDAVVWVRPHPVADPFRSAPARLQLATDDALQRHGLTFYDLLAATDLLVTDYSSVWVDYLALDRPTVGFCPDLREYDAARGLALDPYEAWFPGPVTDNATDLRRLLEAVLDGEDPEREKRARVRELVGPRHADAAATYWALTLGEGSSSRAYSASSRSRPTVGE